MRFFAQRREIGCLRARHGIVARYPVFRGFLGVRAWMNVHLGIIRVLGHFPFPVLGLYEITEASDCGSRIGGDVQGASKLSRPGMFGRG